MTRREGQPVESRGLSRLSQSCNSGWMDRHNVEYQREVWQLPRFEYGRRLARCTPTAFVKPAPGKFIGEHSKHDAQ